MDVDKALELAAAHQDAGRLNEAEAIYEAILQQERDPYALYFLGLIHQKRGRHDLALPLLEEAVDLENECGEFWYALGSTLHALGRTVEAIKALSRAASQEPESAGIHAALGDVLLAHGHHNEATDAFRRAIELDPRLPDIHIRYGNALAAAGRFTEAATAYRSQIERNPEDVHAYNNLGAALVNDRRFSEAVAAYAGAMNVNASLADVHHNMGVALQNQANPSPAVAAYLKAIDFDPGATRAARSVRPHFSHRQIVDSMVALSKCVEFGPQFPKARLFLALAHLLVGDFERGWEPFELRWTAKGTSLVRRFLLPAWDGRKLPGQTILLHAEQGFGDSIQFIRYAPLVADRVGRVLVECEPALQRMLQGVSGIAQVIVKGQPLPAFDAHCPLMSLPLAFGTRLETIPARVPYLFAPPALRESWAKRFRPPTDELKVGLAWAGNPAHINDRNRSISLRRLAPLGAIKRVRFASLQKGSKISPGGEAPPLWVLDPGELQDFADTAALMEQLDLVITVDTSVAHLAGAVGRPVWVLIPFVPDWRWMLDREDSPWYPTMRLFRQRVEGDWDEVIARVAKALAALRAATA